MLDYHYHTGLTFGPNNYQEKNHLQSGHSSHSWHSSQFFNRQICVSFFRPVSVSKRKSSIVNHHGNQRSYSTSFLVKKKARDIARMSAFLRRKTAESLPFSELNSNEIAKLGYNSSLSYKKCASEIISSGSISPTSTTEHEEIRKLEEFKTAATEQIEKDKVIIQNLHGFVSTLTQEINDLKLENTNNLCLKQENEKLTILNCSLRQQYEFAVERFSETMSNLLELETTAKSLESQIDNLRQDNVNKSKDISDLQSKLRYKDQLINTLISEKTTLSLKLQGYHNEFNGTPVWQPVPHMQLNGQRQNNGLF
jgi:hypothetical protein